jgi:membrane-anchored glycerophosphoryl diester phosphodiesterase (GDPDase)
MAAREWGTKDMTSEPLIEDSRPDLGSVIRDSVELIGANWRTLLPAAMLLVALPALLTGLAHLGHAQFLTFLFGLTALAGGCAFHGFAIYAVASDMDGAPATAKECWAVARTLWLPLVGLTVFMAVSIVIGLCLLIVPGVLIYLMWCVAAPVLVLERTDIATALRRSVALTQNRRWKLLLIFLVMILVMGCIEVILMLWPEAFSHTFPLLKAVAEAAVHGGLELIGVVVITVVYKDLLVER